jgi:chromosome segregation ATPase
MRKLFILVACAWLAISVAGCKDDEEELRQLRDENSQLHADLETSRSKLEAIKADPEPELLRDANANLQAQIEDARKKAEELDSRIDDAETQIGWIDSAIENFNKKEWQLVVPEVRDETATAHSRIDDISAAMDDLKTALAAK